MMIGKSGGVKLLSKLKEAKAQRPPRARIIPAPVAKLPKKKYSSAVMVNICFLLAPRVLSKTLSFKR